MGYFNWDKKFETGVARMDDQHQGLIALMNQLFVQNQEGQDKTVLLATLKKLGALTERHFREEEAYMASINYADLGSHTLIHKDLLKTFAEHMQKFERSPSKEVPSPLFTFLKLWLSSHILGIDARYAAAAKQGAA